MNKRIAIAMGLSLTLVTGFCQEAPRAAELKDWTVADSVATRYFRHKSERAPVMAQDPDKIILPSPSGNRFLTVTTFGDLTTDMAVYDVQIFDTKALERALSSGSGAPQPLRRLLIEHAHDLADIDDVLHWESDDTLLLGTTPAVGRRKLRRYTISTGVSTALSGEQINVDPGFSRMASVPGSTLYVAQDLTRETKPPLALKRYPYSEVTATGLLDFFDSFESWRVAAPKSLYGVFGNSAPREVVPLAPGSRVMGIWMSPDGRRAVATIASQQPATGHRYMLIDMASGTAKPTTDAPPEVVADVPKPRQPAIAGGLQFRLRQTSNDPPRLIVSKAGKELDLSGPDPAMKDKWLARMERVSWKEPNGVTIHGGLLLPRKRTPGKPLPLVVQAYVYETETFNTEGPYTHTAYAAQALVGRGIAVLNMDIPWTSPRQVARKPYLAHWLKWDDPKDPQELKIFTENLEAAVGVLTADGTIDPKRIGMVGFSRGGYLTYYTASHPDRVQLAAGISADCHCFGSYQRYNIDVATARTEDEVDRDVESVTKMYGGTFWQNPQSWLEKSPMMNAHRVQAAMLFSTNGIGTAKASLASVFETIGAWRTHRRPFEYLFFPDSGHNVQRPKERYELLLSTVEWMDFWLQGNDPADPVRRERWRKIKTDWQAQQAWEAAGNPVGSKPQR